MKKILIINTHSFIDVITNSSTELFVCDTDKTVEMVKEILQADPNVYGYQEPWVFSLKEYREWKANKKKDWDSKYRDIEGWFYDTENEEDLIYLRKEFIECGDNSGGYWSSDRNPFSNRLDRAARKNGQYDFKAKQAEIEVIYKETEALEQKPEWWTNPLKFYHNDQPVQDLDGKIIIVSESDNSIPYDHFDWIEHAFNAKRQHLG